MTDDDGDRSNRLRQRRRQSQEKAQQSEPSKPSEPDEPDEQSETDKTSVKDEQVGTYFYLPQSQHDDLGEFVEDAQYHYKKEHGVKLEKNRHLYPLVVQYGLDSLDGTDASDVHEKLTSLELAPN